MRVEVYRNLHKGKLSVREVGGKVVAHLDQAVISAPRFVVQPAGRAKVLREQRKNVHAFVRGEFYQNSQLVIAQFIEDSSKWREAYYNPYTTHTFLDKVSGEPVTEAALAIVTTNGVFYRD
jgi:hypothetical protein